MRIYTDGSCLKNPNGPSGWAYAAIDGEYILCDSGGCESSTNNRMEMMAVIEALKFCKDFNASLHILSDSKLVINCAQGLWKRKKNLDLWEEYDFVSRGLDITWTWVKGHNGDKNNELVDSLAKSAAKSAVKSIK